MMFSNKQNAQHKNVDHLVPQMKLILQFEIHSLFIRKLGRRIRQQVILALLDACRRKILTKVLHLN